MDKPSPSNKTPAQARKERKRENDRLAQREHRKRQRQYVEELEAQLELFRQAPGAGELSSLLEENQQLRKEVESYRDLVSILKGHLDQHPLTTKRGTPGPESGSNHNGEASSSATTMFENMDVSDESVGEKDPVLIPPRAQLIAKDAGKSPPPVLPPEDEYSAAWSVLPCSADFLELADLPIETEMAFLQTDLSNMCTPPIVTTRSPRPDQISPPTSDAYLNLQAMDYQTCTPGTPSLLGSLPTVVPVESSDEVAIHDVIQSLKLQVYLQQAAVPQVPKLQEFFQDSHGNSLSLAVKQYISALRQIGQAGACLGVYWITYLSVISKAYETDQCLERLPLWLHPTPIQRSIPHPMAIDFVVWPALRDELIKLHQTAPGRVCEILSASAKHLELRLSLANTLPGSTEKELHDQISNIQNWRLQPEFFNTYPEFLATCSVSLS